MSNLIQGKIGTFFATITKPFAQKNVRYIFKTSFFVSGGGTVASVFATQLFGCRFIFWPFYKKDCAEVEALKRIGL